VFGYLVFKIIFHLDKYCNIILCTIDAMAVAEKKLVYKIEFFLATPPLPPRHNKFHKNIITKQIQSELY
jgi:hypothetical protein